MIKKIKKFLSFMALALMLVSCSIKDDPLEPNDSFSQATSLTSGKTLKAIVLQNNSDVFAIEANPEQKIVFTLSAEEGSPYKVNFTLHDANGNSLQAFDCYREENCLLQKANIKITHSQEGAVLAFELTQEANSNGLYYLTIRQEPDADNMFPNYWKYNITATIN